jgi:hypothetical protein
MVLLQATKYLNRWLGPFLLKNGVRLRQSLLPSYQYRDTPYWDAILGITVGQWLTALEAREHANDVIRAGLQKHKNNQTHAKDSQKSLTLDEEGALRVQVLEEHYLRPALLNVTDEWHTSPRLVRWMRREYLLARFGPHIRAIRTAYPQLTEAFSVTPPTWAQLPPSHLVQATLCSTMAVSSSPSSTKDSDKKKDNGKKKDNYILPTWATGKDRAKVLASMQTVVQRYGGIMELNHGGTLCADVHWPLSTKSKRTAVVPNNLADALQMYGANVYAAAPLNAWLEYPHSSQANPSFLLTTQQQQSFTLWTREYIAHLGDYLCRQIKEYTKMEMPTIVLEVGAGDGILTALLQDYVRQQYQKKRTSKNKELTKDVAEHEAIATQDLQELPITFIATDNQSWAIRPRALVQRMDYRTALEQYAVNKNNNDTPTKVIVICSWMPMNEDWTAVFRKYSTVCEYILIGEADDGQCGDPWATWGNPHFFIPTKDDTGSTQETSDNTKKITVKPSKPLYLQDGFVRKELSFLLPYQFSRYDSFLSKEGSTVSFHRK